MILRGKLFATAFVAAALFFHGAGSAGEAPEPAVASKVAEAESGWSRGDLSVAAKAFAEAAAGLVDQAEALKGEGKAARPVLWAEVEYCIHKAVELSQEHGVSKEISDEFEKLLRKPLPEEISGRLRWAQVELLARGGELKRAARSAAALGFITDWQVIGPFDNERGSGFDTAYGPEAEKGATDLAAEYDGKKHKVRWRRVPVKRFDGYVDLDAMLRPNDECLGYAVTFVHSGEATDAMLRVATDDGVKVWLNDRAVLSNDVRRPCTFDHDVVGVRLERGWNKLLVKVSEQKLDWGFRLRLTATDGSALRGVSARADAAMKHTAAPEGAPEVAARAGVLDALIAELEHIHVTLDGKTLVVHEAKEGFREALEKASGVKVEDWSKAKSPRAVISPIIAKRKLAEWTERLGAYVSVADAAEVARSYYILGQVHRARWARDVEAHPDREAYQVAVDLAPREALYRYAFSEVATDRAVMAAERDENRSRTSLEKALELDPKLAVAASSLGRYYLGNFGNTVKSLEYYARAHAANPEFMHARLGRAAVFGRRNWGPERERIIREAAESDPRSGALRLLLGSLERANGNLPAAAKCYEEALSYSFDDLRGEYRKSLVGVYLEMGKIYKALEVLRQRIELSPFDSGAHFERARLYAAAEDYPQAIAECRKAIEVAAEDHKVIAELGHYYARVRKNDLAAQQWRRAMEIQPNFVTLDRYVQYVEGKTGYDERYAEEVEDILAKAKDVKAEGNEPAVVLLMKTIERVHPDGTNSRTIHQIFKIMNTRGVRSFGSRSVPHIVGEQRVKVKTARVHRADGRVDEGDISISRQEPTGEYAKWSFARISMPPLQIGDVVELEYRVDDIKQGFFGNYFGSSPSFQLTIPTMKAKYVLIVPKRRPVHFHLANGAAQPKKAEDPELDATVYTWEATDVKKLEVEPFMPMSRELVPTVYASTYKRWKDFGTWYWNLIEHQYKMNDAMKAKVAELTAGCANDYERIREVYNFVVSDIRYVPWEFGVHGFKPYRASQVFDRKFGDCKDKSTLINTMLRHLGIEAYPVLIHAEVPRSKQDLTLPMIQHFNHCISYVPAGKDYPEMFLDGTASNHSIDSLPVMDEGALVCIVKPGGAEVKTVPRTGSKHNSTHEAVKVELKETGDAVASVRSKWNGSRAPVIRHNFSVPDRRKLRIERLYGRPYPGASCDKDLKFSDLTYLNEPVVFEYKVTLPRFVRHEGEEWKLKPLKGFLRGRLGTLFPNRFSDLASVAKREHDLVFSQRWSFRADQSYDLPEGMKVVTKPENVDVTTKFGRLVITYEVEGRSLKVSKQLSLETVRVAAEDYQEFRRFCNEVDEKEFREIILGTE